jgi:hypothetical protein
MDRRAERRLLGPGVLAFVEHIAAHDVGADAREGFLEQRVVAARLAARHAEARLKGAADTLLIHCLMDARAAFAERPARPAVRSGDEAVECHADIDKTPCYQRSP